MENQTAKPSPLIVWWILWAAIATGQVFIYLLIRPTGGGPDLAGLRFLPVAPLAVATLIRWLVLPRMKVQTRALPLFVAGLALADACGIIGMFLVPDLRSTYFVLGLLGVAQFVPLFATRYEQMTDDRAGLRS